MLRILMIFLLLPGMLISGGLVSLTNFNQISAQKMNIDLNNTDIEDVMKIFSEKMGLNIVRNRNVEAKITVRLKDVPVTDAFRIVCKANNLDYSVEKNLIRIFNAKDKLLFGDNVLCYPLRNAKAETVHKKLMEMGGNDGKKDAFGLPVVYFDDRINSLFIVANPDFGGLESMEQLISQLDKATPQVLLEAKIIAVKLSKNTSYGIRWNAIFKGVGVNMPFGLGFGSSASSSSVKSFVVESKEKISPDLTINALVNALATEGDVKTLSSPRLMVLNNQEAKIIEGNNEPYKEVVKDNYGGTTENWKFVEVGIGMTVKPTVYSNMIELKVDPEISSATREVGTEAAPTITKSQLSTSVLVKDGSTLILGGLIKDNKQKTGEGLPLLSRIPIIKYLFSSKDSSSTKYEIVFMITPTIIRQ